MIDKQLAHYLLLFSLIIFVIYIFYILIVIRSGSKINNPILLRLIDLTGLHIINNHPISKQFHQYLSMIMDYNRKLFIISGPDNANIGILEQNAPLGIDRVGVHTFVSISYQVLSDINNWNLIVKLLSCYRTSIPCNGFILLLSIVDPNRDLIDTIVNRLSKLNKHFSYPIYIIFYNLELLPGFNSFIHVLNNSDRNMILGWSNTDYSMDKTPYSNTHLDSLVKQINSHIFMKLNQLIDSSSLEQNQEDLYILPYYISDYILNNLYTILNTLFYNDGNYFFRGVYFMGKYNDAQVFAQNTIHSLIIQDNLVVTDMQYKTRYSSLIQRGFIVGLLILIMLIPIFYRKLVNKVDNNLSAIIGLERIINKDGVSTYSRFNTLIHNIDVFSKNNLNITFIPASWFSNINRKIRKIINKTYSKVIHEEIYDYYALLLNNAAMYRKETTEMDFSEYSILNSVEFIDLYNYTQHISKLNKLYQEISDISKVPSLNNFAHVFKELHNKDLPQLFYSHFDLYNKHIKSIHNNLPDINHLKYDLQTTLFNKINAFGSTLSNIGDIKLKLGAINQNLLMLQDNPAQYNEIDILTIINLFNQLKIYLDDPKYSWINAQKIDLGMYYNQVIDIISNSNLFGMQCANKFKNTIDLSVKQAKIMLAETKVPVFGQIFDFKNYSYVLSQPILQFIIIMQELCKNKLLDPDNIKANLNMDVTNYTWNLPRISNILSIISSIEDMLSIKLDLLPIESRGYVQQITFGVIQRKIEAELMASCDTSLPIINKSFHELQVQNLSKAKPILIEIISFLQKRNMSILSGKLQQMLIQQCNVILKELYTILETDQVYIIDNRFFLNPLLTPKMLSDLLQSNHTQFMNLSSKAMIILDLMDDLSKLSPSLVESSMYQKWKDLVSYVTPGNTLPLDELELFLNKLLSCKNILEVTNLLKTVTLSTEDFIRQRQSAAIDTVNLLVKLNASKEFESLYPNIIEQFNLYLKGYFPFSNLQSPDLPKENAARFDEFWTNTKDLAERLADILSSEEKYKNSISFIKNLGKSMKWINAMLKPRKQKLSVNIKIRDCFALEKNVNQLSKWIVAFGSKSNYAIEDGNESQVLQCEMNNEINLLTVNQTTIDFAKRIAQGSKFRFYPGSDTDNLIQGMSYNSNFSLLRMLARYYDHKDDSLLYLKFQFKLIDQNTKTIDDMISWVSIKLSGIEYGDFPYEAPSNN